MLALLFLISLAVGPLGAVISPATGAAHDTQSKTASSYTHGETLWVANTTVSIEGEYTQAGDIKIAEGGTLVIEGFFTILQENDFQYSINIMKDSALIVKNSTVTSSYALILNADSNAYIQIANSTLTFPGASKFQTLQSAVEIVNSNLAVNTLSITQSIIHIESSILTTPTIYLNNVLTGTIEDTVLKGTLNATDSKCALINTAVSEITVAGNSDVQLYKQLIVSVLDAVNVPVGGAVVQIKWHLNNTLHQAGITSKEGIFSTYVITETFSPFYKFLGNYKITAVYGGNINTTNIAMPYFKSAVKLEYQIIPKHIKLQLPAVLISAYYSTGSDIVIAENTTYILEDLYSAANKLAFTYIQDGNIKVSNNATMIIRSNTVLNIRQSIRKKYFIAIEESGKMIIENSSVVNNYPMNLYMFGNASLEVTNSMLNFTIIATEQSHLTLKDTKLTGNIYAKNSKVYMDKVELTAESFATINTYTKLIITNSKINTCYLDLNMPSFDIADTEFNQPLVLSSSGYLTNVTAPSISVGLKTVYKCWWLEVKVLNGHNLPVSNAEVRVYRTENLTDTFYTSAKTDENGIAKFRLPGNRLHNNYDEFIGNYRIVAYAVHDTIQYESTHARTAVDTNRKATVRFEAILVPPYNITVILEAPAAAVPNQQLTISGILLYNAGPDYVANANVTIEIIEIGYMINITTDTKGRYVCTVLAPSQPGSYTIKVSAIDPKFNLTAVKTASLYVGEKRLEYNAWPIIGAIVMAALTALVLKFVLQAHITRKATAAEAVYGARRKAIIKWIVEQLIKGR